MASRGLVDDLVIFGRFTTFVGETKYYSLPIHVVDYESVELITWRGAMPDPADALELTMEESLDNEDWSARWTSSITETEQTWIDQLKYPWLRVMVEPIQSGAAATGGTGYVIGRLFRRRSS